MTTHVQSTMYSSCSPYPLLHWTPFQDEISSLEEKLAALKTQKDSIVVAISEKEDKIASVEEELASEKSQLAEEKEAILLKEQQLAKQQVGLVV